MQQCSFVMKEEEELETKQDPCDTSLCSLGFSHRRPELGCSPDPHWFGLLKASSFSSYDFIGLLDFTVTAWYCQAIMIRDGVNHFAIDTDC